MGVASYPICELIPNLAWSSGANRPGRIRAERSVWIPACFPRRKPAIVSCERVVEVANPQEVSMLVGLQYCGFSGSALQPRLAWAPFFVQMNDLTSQCEDELDGIVGAIWLWEFI